MKAPKSTKGLLAVLIDIAHEGNCIRVGEGRLTQDEHHRIGALIAGIQNDLGEMRDLLEKFALEYNG